MNLSGVPVLDFLDDHSVDVENILVLVDDVNLPVGEIRLRKSGSDGGHNGIKSIIYHLQNDSFPRLRFGIGNEFEKGEMAEFVLAKFAKEELSVINKSIEFAVQLIEEFVSGGYKSMLDFYSKSKKNFSANTNGSDALIQPKNSKNE
jgi:PTH1 family peptidyl-tRNA hydrolase